VVVLYCKTIGWKQVTKNGIILERTREKMDFDRIIAAFPKTSTFLFVPLWLKPNGQIGASLGVACCWNRFDTTLHLDWGTLLWAKVTSVHVFEIQGILRFSIAFMPRQLLQPPWHLINTNGNDLSRNCQETHKAQWSLGLGFTIGNVGKIGKKLKTAMAQLRQAG